jgi:peptidyl-prolyl cis-trans isomerase A (cyclophilin A)
MFGRKTFDPPAINVPGEGHLRVKIETSMGTINGHFYEDLAPKTVANFVGLATGQTNDGKPYYDGLIFHRCITDFMVQGGCPEGSGRGGPGYVIEDEFGKGLSHTRGGLFSMANAGPNTGGSQFFLTEVATPWLDGKHAIFGEVDEDSVALIKKMTRVARGAGDRPKTPIVMSKVTVYRG